MLREFKKMALYLTCVAGSLLMANCSVYEKRLFEKTGKEKRLEKRAEKKRMDSLKPIKPKRPKSSRSIFPETGTDLILNHIFYKEQTLRIEQKKLAEYRVEKEGWKVCMEEWRDMKKQMRRLPQKPLDIIPTDDKEVITIASLKTPAITDTLVIKSEPQSKNTGSQYIIQN